MVSGHTINIVLYTHTSNTLTHHGYTINIVLYTHTHTHTHRHIHEHIRLEQLGAAATHVRRFTELEFLAD